MRVDIRIVHPQRGRTIRYEGYEFPNKEAALDFGKKKAMHEFGPGPWDRGEITIGTTVVEAPTIEATAVAFDLEQGGD